MIRSIPQQVQASRKNAAPAVGYTLAAFPMFILFYVLLILPFMADPDGKQGRPLNNLFWPVMAGLTLALVLKNRSQIDSGYFRTLPIVSLTAYLIFAVASVGWAYSPESAFSRIAVHVLICFVLLLPYALPLRTAHTIPVIHLIYAASLIVSAFYVLSFPPSPIGHTGYFVHKQFLGLLGAVAIIVSAHELLFGTWWRRVIAAVTCSLAIWLIMESQSKSALVFAFVSLLFSLLILLGCKWLRATPAYIVAGLVIASSFVNNPMERIAYDSMAILR